jgi:DNA polymerase I
MGVEPAQVADLLALKGDAVDNIPGAPGIGDKGARDLIAQFGSVEGAIAHAAEVQRKAYRESLQNNVDRIRMSKRLATIETDVPIEFSLDAAAAHTPDPAALKAVYQDHGVSQPAQGTGAGGRHAGARIRHVRRCGRTMRVAGRSAARRACRGGYRQIGRRRTGAGCDWPGLEAGRSARGIGRDGERTQAVAGRCGRAQDRLRRESGAAGTGGDGNRGRRLRSRRDAVRVSSGCRPAGCSLEELARRRLDLKLGAAPEQHADIILELNGQLEPAIDARGLRELYSTIELPLARVLRAWNAGILIDRAELQRLSTMMEGGIARLTERIHTLAGKPFNISSPQQLGRVLFEDLNLPAPVKYGKGKAISTAADVLETLAPDHEIVRQVLEYRQLTKLKGTYVDALPLLVDPRTGRLHTSFNQAGAATGRLSSSNPNLQNIPVRTELGREIRAAFVPRPGWKLITADYSQIELRLLAHFSGDPLLVESFRDGEDIHTRTASEVMGVPPMMVTPEARRDAKAVNFGIVYGISAFGLAAQLGISRGEAERTSRLLRALCRRAPIPRRTIAAVRQSGVTRTLFGRERPIPDMNSRNPNARGFAERTAVNSPLQGTAADLIKLAMVRVQAALESGGYRSEMLLQVHDELVFECPPEEVEAVSTLVQREMEGVGKLAVPLEVDIGVGDNWRDAK